LNCFRYPIGPVLGTPSLPFFQLTSHVRKLPLFRRDDGRGSFEYESRSSQKVFILPGKLGSTYSQAITNLPLFSCPHQHYQWKFCSQSILSLVRQKFEAPRSRYQALRICSSSSSMTALSHENAIFQLSFSLMETPFSSHSLLSSLPLLH
jgi:hypothetical protein